MEKNPRKTKKKKTIAIKRKQAYRHNWVNLTKIKAINSIDIWFRATMKLRERYESPKVQKYREKLQIA